MIRNIIVLIACCCVTANVSYSADNPGEKWWPSEWGADDQLGALNRLTPAKVLAAAGLITEGKIYDMGRVFEEDMPLFDLTPQHRKYSLTVPGAPSWGPMGENRLAWNEDYISGHITQNGTQFDSLSHMATFTGKPGDLNEVRYYNGYSHADIGTGRGFSKLGVEHVTPIFTRGVLIDVAGLKGRMLECTEEVTLADLKAALKNRDWVKMRVQPGDALFYYTGWGTLWKTDNQKFNSCVPGLTDEGRRLGGGQKSHPGWHGQLGGRDHTRTGPDAICAEPPEIPGGKRYLYHGKHRFQRLVAGSGLRVCFCVRRYPVQGRDRFAGPTVCNKVVLFTPEVQPCRSTWKIRDPWR